MRAKPLITCFFIKQPTGLPPFWNGLYTDGSGAHAQTLTSGVTPAIHDGLNIPNVLAVVAHGSTLDLYVNKQPVANVSNPSYGYGQIGVAAADANDATEVVFSDARVWSI